ncbi:hypothetical protein FKG94_18065 [Exilibacterium tricleocarpae]|uniref:Chemotaxis protein CheA n=1 Tax=Exilibacterium tricleocarpae TaxID=2591008 RepID=A0A545T5V8_9GAMM|nr:Hpt domain-containing protein [Exilibacterium tricleocarpae]TQV72604.1 hypothetical protein FKG94_18065 [Exilibacterium tricleocarpae]
MSLVQFGNFLASHFSTKGTRQVSQINAGLLEIDSDFIIRKSHSRVLESLLGESPLVGKSFARIIRSRTAPEDGKKALLVLNKLVKQRNIIKPVIKHNPFDCLKIKIRSPKGRSIVKYIRCEFGRSDSFEHYGKWTVTIRDISKSIRISKLIKRSNQKAEQKISTVMSLLQFEKDLIKEYLEGTTTTLKDILANLSTRPLTTPQIKKKIESIFGSVHQMKGDAAILNLKSISDQAHQFENLLSDLSMRKTLSTKDLRRLISPLKAIIGAVKEVKELFEKIVEGGWSDSPEGGANTMMRRLQYLVKRLEMDSKKRVIIVDDGYTDSAIPAHLRRVINGLVTQLARNAVIHGIEDPQTRRRRGKTPYGCLHISVRHEKGKLIVAMRDDGYGIDPEKIRNAAFASKFFTADQVRRWNKTQLLNAMFRPGVSTAKTVTQHAGRGVGLDVIKSTVEKYGGTIGLKSTLDQFTEFTMAFPRQLAAPGLNIPTLHSRSRR